MRRKEKEKAENKKGGQNGEKIRKKECKKKGMKYVEEV